MPAFVATMPKAWAFPAFSKATGMECVSRRRLSSTPAACPWSGASPCPAASRTSPTAPMRPFEAASTASSVQAKNYLFDALIARIHRQPLRWQLILVIGQPGDPTHDATIAWPAGRERVDVGTLTLDRMDAEDTSAATDINFDPLVLPAGIAPSDDPLLSARSAVYSQSFTRREGEAKQPSAITPAEVRRGE